MRCRISTRALGGLDNLAKGDARRVAGGGFDYCAKCVGMAPRSTVDIVLRIGRLID